MIKQFLKYGLSAGINYILMFVLMTLFVEKFGTKPNITYLVIITLIYIETYAIYTKFVFKSNFNKENLLKYILFLVIFWFLNNLLYNINTEILKIQYILALIINMAILGTFRFFIQKKIVFKS